LKDDIDSGRTGEKVNLADRGLSPLGTDDEAAGHPPSPAAVDEARRYETRERWVDGVAKNPAMRLPVHSALAAFIAFIVLVGVLFAVLLWRA
jgi:hypothetical protein